MMQYGHHLVDEDDCRAVMKVLEGDALTCGEEVREFEHDICALAGVPFAVAVSSGTAALHAAMATCGISAGDEVIVPAMTFVATANVVVHQGATPVIVDCRPGDLLIDPQRVADAITPRTRAVIAVDYTGLPASYDLLSQVTGGRGITLVADACHALGGRSNGRPVGQLADLTAFSFHPAKHITCGEGGMLVGRDHALAGKARAFRSHGIDSDWLWRSRSHIHGYAMTELGLNYRMSDINAALGRSQLRKLPRWLEHRRTLAALYDEAFSDGTRGVSPLVSRPGPGHARHLYVVRFCGRSAALRRETSFQRMRANGIGVNVHYPPLHLHPFYQGRFGCRAGDCPRVEKAADRIMTLPLHQGMTGNDAVRVIEQLFASLGTGRAGRAPRRARAG